jgi:diaminopimelate epimerase
MEFVKLNAAGNDFVGIDLRGLSKAGWRPSAEEAGRWCNRRHGIGADGVLLLEEEEGVDFKLTFLNPDGSEAFCGNGARAAFAWWRLGLSVPGNLARFKAMDGLHEGHWIQGEPCVDLRVKMAPKDTPHGTYVNSGTEHLVVGLAQEELPGLDLIELARPIRSHADFAPQGVNVNVVSTEVNSEGRYSIRTYEKGVEAETLSCGSGAVAAAAVLRWSLGGEAFKFRAPGGTMGVVFEGKDRAWLSGPVEMPFKGAILPS